MELLFPIERFTRPPKKKSAVNTVEQLRVSSGGGSGSADVYMC